MAVVRTAENLWQKKLFQFFFFYMFLTAPLCSQPTPPPPPVATKQQYLCQPLLDVVMANIRSPVFNHSLYRTFSPAMTAIHGPAIV